MKKTTKDNTQIFIEKAIKIHGNKYDYSLVDYKNSSTKIKIICSKHGVFEQIPSSHLRSCGCKKCSFNAIWDTQKFIVESKKIHGSKYDYSKSIYVGALNKLIVTCRTHGDFSIKPSHHIKGSKGKSNPKPIGCGKCGLKIKSLSNLINDFNIIHDNFYDYSLISKNLGSRSKLKIICPIHGSFEQISDSHQKGKGCPNCNSIGQRHEPKLFKFITKNYINCNLLTQYKPFWLKIREKGYQQSLDIFIEKYNIAIEYQGEQHFFPVNLMGGIKSFIANQERDNRKRLLCEANGVKLFYFTYKPKNVPSDYPHKVYTDEQELKQAIEDYIKSLDKIIS